MLAFGRAELAELAGILKSKPDPALHVDVVVSLDAKLGGEG